MKSLILKPNGKKPYDWSLQFRYFDGIETDYTTIVRVTELCAHEILECGPIECMFETPYNDKFVNTMQSCKILSETLSTRSKINEQKDIVISNLFKLIENVTELLKHGKTETAINQIDNMMKDEGKELGYSDLLNMEKISFDK